MGGSMLHHVMIKVDSWPKAREYYSITLKELGYELAVEFEKIGGFTAKNDTPGLYIQEEAVKAYYKTALAAGGKDNGAPGPRGHIASGGIAAFVIDPWNNNIEVAFEPSSSA